MRLFRKIRKISLLLTGIGCAMISAAQAAPKKQPTTLQNTADSAAVAAQRCDLEIGRSMETFFNIFREVNLYYVDTTSPKKIVKIAADAMLEGLDPYTEYLPAEEMADFETMTTGKYAGLGALIRKSSDGRWVEIAEPYRGTPSDRAGLKAGDRILSVDGVDMAGREVAFASDRMRGKAGTVATLVIAPIADTTQTRTVRVKRERIAIPAVPYYGWVSDSVGRDSVGYIRLNSFTEKCADEVRTALNALQQQGGEAMRGLVLDLRGNTGGILGEAVKIVGFFVPRNTVVVTTRGRMPQMNSTYRTVGEPIAPTVPLVVLIDRSSASASEIVAGALQDLDRAVVIGQRSFGKGLVQSTRPVGENGYVKLTSAKYYTPSGRCIQALDYSHRNEDGSVGAVPDSLIASFRTAGGRMVYDGGGIMPDVRISPEYLGKFTAILMGLGYVDDFANRYAANHAPESDFAVDDTTYAAVCDCMADKPIAFESGTERLLKQLRRMAEREKYADRIASQLDTVAAKIREDKRTELQVFGPEIREVLGDAVATRWFYDAGRIARQLRRDNVVRRAAEVLLDRSEYTRIVTMQNTDKK